MPLLPLMSNKAILCHICSQHHGSLHVYSLVDGPIPGSSRGSGLLTLLLPPWGCKPPQLLQSLLQLLHRGTLRSVQWLAASFHLCICQALADSLRRQPYQVSISKHFPASTIPSVFYTKLGEKQSRGAIDICRPRTWEANIEGSRG